MTERGLKSTGMGFDMAEKIRTEAHARASAKYGMTQRELWIIAGWTMIWLIGTVIAYKIGGFWVALIAAMIPPMVMRIILCCVAAAATVIVLGGI